MGDLELLFLGTGTSAGIPMIGCHCAVCTSPDSRDKRTRTSAVLSYNRHHVLIDATPELRLQCVSNDVGHIDALVFTHAHADHLMGLDDVRRFNAIKKGPLDVWADANTFETVSQCFGYAFRKPDPAAKVFRPHLEHRLIEGPFQIGPERWTPIPLMHGGMQILGFRVRDLAYCTDVSHVPEASYPLLQGLDVLVIDALAWHEHPTHFSIHQALNVVERVKPRRTYFVHMAHNVGHEETSSRLPDGVALAYDGLRIRST